MSTTKPTNNTANNSNNANTTSDNNANTSTKPERKEIDKNSIWVSAQKSVKLYADIALRMMLENEIVELHGLGAAVPMTADISQHLTALKKATIKKISTSSVPTNGKNGIGGGRKPELTIILQRTEIPKLPDQLTDDQQQLVNMVEDDDN